jgi:hypothetical protein
MSASILVQRIQRLPLHEVMRRRNSYRCQWVAQIPPPQRGEPFCILNQAAGCRLAGSRLSAIDKIASGQRVIRSNNCVWSTLDAS